VNEFDDRGRLAMAAAFDPARARDRDDDQRAQALTASTDDVLRDLIDQHHIAGQALANDTIDL
jgi:hypothetical protein